MLYKLCLLKISGFWVKDLLYEYKFPLKVWWWILLEKQFLSQSGQLICSILILGFEKKSNIYYK